MASGLPFWVPLALLAAAVAALAGAWWAYGHVRHIRDTPTSKTRSVALGPVELVGTGEPRPGGALVEAPFSGTPCIGYEWRIEEQRTRTVTETDDKGNTRTRTETYWEVLQSGEEMPAFAVRDETGMCLVDPAGGSAPLEETYCETSGFFSPPPERVVAFLKARGIRHDGWFGMKRSLRFIERSFLPGKPLYVLGTAVPRPDAPYGATGTDALVVQKEGRVPFILSTSSEKGLVMKRSLLAGALLVVGLGLAGAGAYLLAAA